MTNFYICANATDGSAPMLNITGFDFNRNGYLGESEEKAAKQAIIAAGYTLSDFCTITTTKEERADAIAIEPETIPTQPPANGDAGAEAEPTPTVATPPPVATPTQATDDDDVPASGGVSGNTPASTEKEEGSGISGVKRGLYGLGGATSGGLVVGGGAAVEAAIHRKEALKRFDAETIEQKAALDKSSSPEIQGIEYNLLPLKNDKTVLLNISDANRGILSLINSQFDVAEEGSFKLKSDATIPLENIKENLLTHLTTYDEKIEFVNNTEGMPFSGEFKAKIVEGRTFLSNLIDKISQMEEESKAVPSSESWFSRTVKKVKNKIPFKKKIVEPITIQKEFSEFQKFDGELYQLGMQRARFIEKNTDDIHKIQQEKLDALTETRKVGKAELEGTENARLKRNTIAGAAGGAVIFGITAAAAPEIKRGFDWVAEKISPGSTIRGSQSLATPVAPTPTPTVTPAQQE